MKLVLETIGSDPEFFVKDKKSGDFVPSAIITNGTKDFPEETKTDGFLIHKDNLSVEGNIPPAYNKEGFVGNMMFLKGILNTLASIKNCEIVSTDKAVFDKRFLKMLDADDFGCSSFVNSWSGATIRTPSMNSNFRVAGFHIHLGYAVDGSNAPTKFEIDKVIGRAFDLFLTAPSDEIHTCKERRNSGYGSYGSIRSTSYGVECRSLGSYFTQDRYLGLTYDQVVKMFDWLNCGDNFEKIMRLNYSCADFETIKKINGLYKLKAEEVNV